MATSEERLTPIRTADTFRVGEWHVAPALDEISRSDAVVRLEPRAMKLLVRLAQSPNQVLSSQHLLNTVWSDVVVGPASVYQAISQLRKALGDTDPDPIYIATIPRKGYRLIAPVQGNVEPMSSRVLHASAQVARSPANRRAAHLGWGLAALTAMIVASGATFLAVRDVERPHETPVQPATLDSHTIAVLPFSPATHDRPSQTLAPIVTDLLRTRLATVRDLVVISHGSSNHAAKADRPLLEAAKELNARYLMHGKVRQNADRVNVDIALLDAQTNAPVWSRRFDRPVAELAAMNDQILRETARVLHIAPDPPARTSAIANAPIDLGAYELYLRGQQLMSTYRAEAAKEASVLFSRVTTLDPSFARGYLAYGEALLLAADLGAWSMSDELALQAGKAFDRALELNPALGGAWAQRARLTPDPVAAEEMYRRAIQLAPGRDESYYRYSSFLFAQRRRGEALELIDRARRIDPLSAPLCQQKAVFLVATHGDVAGMKRLLRQALAINPEFPTALSFLGDYGALFTGELAEGIRLLERAAAVDRERNDFAALDLYLDLDDPSAATAMARENPDHPGARFGRITIAQYEGDTARAAKLARELYRHNLANLSNDAAVRNDVDTYALYAEMIGIYSHAANAIRDGAIASGDFATAVDLLRRRFELTSHRSPMRNRGFVLTYAHTLLLAGETDDGRELLHSMLKHLEAESIGRPAHWFSWERAGAFAMLGEDERALQELEASVESGRVSGWWYTERDPIFARVRSDPRFQALIAKTSAHRKRERAFLDEMRRKGEVPSRQ